MGVAPLRGREDLATEGRGDGTHVVVVEVAEVPMQETSAVMLQHVPSRGPRPTASDRARRVPRSHSKGLAEWLQGAATATLQ